MTDAGVFILLMDMLLTAMQCNAQNAPLEAAACEAAAELKWLWVKMAMKTTMTRMTMKMTMMMTVEMSRFFWSDGVSV